MITWASHLELARIARIEPWVRDRTLRARDGAEREHGPNARGALRREQRHRATRAVPAEVDARRIDVGPFRNELDRREYVVHFAQEHLDAAGVVVVAA